jgi:hypothetical protein
VEENGLEPSFATTLPANGLGRLTNKFSTDSSALDDETGTLTAEVRLIVQACPELTEDDRKAVLAVIRKASQRQTDALGD